MPLSRIYQGRTNSLQILTPTPQEVWDHKALAGFDSPLWRHHALFQEAVNYYHLCLVALAGADTTRPLAKLHEQMKASWEEAKTDSEDSWRVHLSRRLGVPAASLFEAALAKVLEGNETPERARELAGELLLNKIEGDIQQAGRGYWPRFCDPKANPTYDYSATARASASGLTKLASVIHAENVSEEALKQVADEMDLSWTVKLQPDKNFVGTEARARLLEAAQHFIKLAESPLPKLAEVLARFPDGLELWQALPEKIAKLPEEIQVPRNRKASPDLTFATLLFQQFPSPFTAAVLGLSVGKPKSVKAPKVVEKVSARRKANAVTQAVVIEEPEMDFGELGDDPIKLARGERGFVFPAFTSLSTWAVPGPHVPVWKEFDIAAFKEALKTVNQFKLKTSERNALLAEAQRRLDYMDEKTSEWKSGDSDEPGHIPPRMKSDPNFALIEALTQDEGVSNKATGDKHIPKGVYTGGLRGFYAIKKDWCELWERKAEKNQGTPTEEELLSIVTDYQRDHVYDVGDVNLFRTLCEPIYWPLWQPLTDEQKVERSHAGRAKDMISAYREWLELKEDVVRLALPIRFTPAHAENSRRLYMFSDISGSQGAQFGSDGKSLEVSIAHEVEGKLQPVRAKLEFTAPRASRDELESLSGGSESMRWLQPMMKALGCPETEMPALEKCAVSLMPDVVKKGQAKCVRLLLNFPATLEPEGLIRHLGKQAVWYKQFNGTYKPRTQQLDTGLHLYWPGVDKAPEAEDASAWWNRDEIRDQGFSVLSVDLGQRDAGAWALLESRADKAFSRNKQPFIDLGEAGGKLWSTALLGLGMLRLPGEDARTGALDAKGSRAVEFHGKAGRNAKEAEWQEAREMAFLFGGEEAQSRLGPSFEHLSHPEQNGELLRIISRAQSRLARFHRWSCRIQEKLEATADDVVDYGQVDELLTKTAETMLESLKAFYTDSGGMLDSKSKQPLTLVGLRKKLDAMKVEPRKVAELLKPHAEIISQRLKTLIPELRLNLKVNLERLANRELPLRHRDWVWNEAAEKLVQGDYKKEENPKWIRGQRGLAMARIEQIENLRKRFMSLRRQMKLSAGVLADAGMDDKGKRLEEPCEDILKKLDRMKQQRVNQTAHLILAQALGLRLRPHLANDTEREEKDIHGEYEPIPGREPVDFIVMEDLSRYLSSQGRAPSENGRLMKWCHRAVLAKLKQMCEPFGIPVLEVPAAYSSRFCALTGVPGFRAVEVHDGHAEEFRWKRLIKKAEKDKSSKDAEAAAMLFDQLQNLNIEAHEARKQDKKLPLRTLFAPVAGGPLFIPMVGGGPRQADMNAAINLGLRAIASPTCLRARPKIRAELTGGNHQALLGNKLEKAASLVLEPPKEPTKELAAQKRTNFFLDEKFVGKFDTAYATTGGKKLRLSGGMALWKAIKEGSWQRVKKINDARIAAWKSKTTKPDPSDEIPL